MKKMRKYSTFIVLLVMISVCRLTSVATTLRANYYVVPLPDVVAEIKSADFVLGSKSQVIVYDHDELRTEAHFLSDCINEMTGQRLAVRPMNSDRDRWGNLVLSINDHIEQNEAYQITIQAQGVEIAARTSAGVFYGVQTLRKSLPLATDTDLVTLPAAQVSATPRFGYRGMHLDCSRHYFSIDVVKHYIDLLALHGMNRLHWHLTDDQGWRIEIKQYPKLTEVGAWRSGTVVGRNSDIDDGIRYGGFYTQQQIKDIVRYAAQRHITIIPEIDMPGHMLGALAAYPELGCTGGPYEVWHKWGVSEDILCVGKDATLRFVENVLDEVMALFPSQYIHIGGDESPRLRWEQCHDCQQRIVHEGICERDGQSAAAQLQGWFTNHIQRYLAQHGRRIIGWDELLGCNVDQSATIMSWRGPEPGATGARLGHDVIMTPVDPCYFDYYQTDKTWNEPLCFGGCNTLEKVYHFEPVANELGEDARNHILGVQANLWTEYVVCPQMIEHQVLPRMAALCEVQWVQPDVKDFTDFQTRLVQLTALYDHNGWHYFKP